MSSYVTRIGDVTIQRVIKDDRMESVTQAMVDDHKEGKSDDELNTDNIEKSEDMCEDDEDEEEDDDEENPEENDVLRELNGSEGAVASVMESMDLLREVKTEPLTNDCSDEQKHEMDESRINETLEAAFCQQETNTINNDAANDVVQLLSNNNLESEFPSSAMNEDVMSDTKGNSEEDEVIKRKQDDPEEENDSSHKKKRTDEEANEVVDKEKNKKAINLRRNIREVMDENQLDEATLAAQRQEMERLRRVQDQQKYLREVQRQIHLQRQNDRAQSRVMNLLQGNGSASLFRTNTATENAYPLSLPPYMTGEEQPHHHHQPSTVVVKVGSSGPPQALNKEVLKAIRGSSGVDLPESNSSSSSSSFFPTSALPRHFSRPHMVTPSVSIAPVKAPDPGRKGSMVPDIVTISSSSEDEEEAQAVKKVAEGASSGLLEDDDCIVISEPSDGEEDETDVDPTNSGIHTNDLYNCPDSEGRVLINVGKPESDPEIFLAPQIARVIKPHQIGGVRFLFDNVVESLERYQNSTGFGCILAHSMGLGKTLQIVSFCDVFLRETPAKSVVCIMPINTLQNWVAEFNLWLPVDPTTSPLAASGPVLARQFKIYVLNDLHKTIASRARVVQEWRRDGGVLLIGYEMYRQLSLKRPGRFRKGKKRGMEEEVVDDVKNKPLLEEMHEALVKPGPDLVICDEGHRIKNSHASISHALKQIRTKRRIVLTGYPLQNNLLEYWCMVDFVRPNYLGTKTEFSNMFERPIQNGQCIDSTPQDIRLMRYRAHVLHSLLEGFVQRRSHSVLRHSLPQKEEYVLLVRMNTFQRELYDTFMNEVVRTKAVPNPLKAFAVCCKIWNHPDILYNFLKKREMDELQDLDLEETVNMNAANSDVNNKGGPKGGLHQSKGETKKGKNAGNTKKSAVSTPIKPAATVPPTTQNEIKQEMPDYNNYQNHQQQQQSQNYDSQQQSQHQQQHPHQFQMDQNYQNYNQQGRYYQNYYQNYQEGGGYNSGQNYEAPQNYQNYNSNYNNYQNYDNFWPKKEPEEEEKKEKQQTFQTNKGFSGGQVVYNSDFNQQFEPKKEFNYDWNNTAQSSYPQQQQQQQQQQSQPQQPIPPPQQPQQQQQPPRQQQHHEPPPSQYPYPQQYQYDQYPRYDQQQQQQEYSQQNYDRWNNQPQQYPHQQYPQQQQQQQQQQQHFQYPNYNFNRPGPSCGTNTDDDKIGPGKEMMKEQDEHGIKSELNKIEDEKKTNDVAVQGKPAKEDTGIPYDWAVELLKGYVPGDIRASGKMTLFFSILEESIALGDRILVFSQSLCTLNLMEELLQVQKVYGKQENWARNVNYYRLDGSTTAIEREKLINEFNSNPNLHLFLVSTRAGSLGINLVGANRVIVFDASWNPCHDTQAVCRVYRYGQKKPCFVYRLVTDNCLEKKIYDRQINKQGMSDRVVDECNPDAHLSIKEVTSLCWDDKEDDPAPKDYTELQDNYIDIVIQKLLQKHSSILSKEPFQHESLLVDRKEKKLSQAEKRLAKRSYELEKQAAGSGVGGVGGGLGMSRPLYPGGMMRPGIDKPMASVRPMQSELGSQMVRGNGSGNDSRRGWIPASVWQRQGMSAQEMTLPLDVVIPTNAPDRSSIVLKAGQKVMVLKSPKGIYMQLENGKIIAIRTSFKVGKDKEAKKQAPNPTHHQSRLNSSTPSQISPQIPPHSPLIKQPTPMIPENLRNNSAVSITPSNMHHSQQNQQHYHHMQQPQHHHHQHHVQQQQQHFQQPPPHPHPSLPPTSPKPLGNRPVRAVGPTSRSPSQPSLPPSVTLIRKKPFEEPVNIQHMSSSMISSSSQSGSSGTHHRSSAESDNEFGCSSASVGTSPLRIKTPPGITDHIEETSPLRSIESVGTMTQQYSGYIGQHHQQQQHYPQQYQQPSQPSQQQHFSPFNRDVSISSYKEPSNQRYKERNEVGTISGGTHSVDNYTREVSITPFSVPPAASSTDLKYSSSVSASTVTSSLPQHPPAPSSLGHQTTPSSTPQSHFYHMSPQYQQPPSQQPHPSPHQQSTPPQQHPQLSPQQQPLHSHSLQQSIAHQQTSPQQQPIHSQAIQKPIPQQQSLHEQNQQQPMLPQPYQQPLSQQQQQQQSLHSQSFQQQPLHSQPLPPQLSPLHSQSHSQPQPPLHSQPHTQPQSLHSQPLPQPQILHSQSHPHQQPLPSQPPSQHPQPLHSQSHHQQSLHSQSHHQQQPLLQQPPPLHNQTQQTHQQPLHTQSVQQSSQQPPNPFTAAAVASRNNINSYYAPPSHHNSYYQQSFSSQYLPHNPPPPQ